MQTDFVIPPAATVNVNGAMSIEEFSARPKRY
jgi:hypothetical protein